MSIAWKKLFRRNEEEHSIAHLCMLCGAELKSLELRENPLPVCDGCGENEPKMRALPSLVRTYGPKVTVSIRNESSKPIIFSFKFASVVVENYGQGDENLIIRAGAAMRIEEKIERGAASREVKLPEKWEVEVWFTERRFWVFNVHCILSTDYRPGRDDTIIISEEDVNGEGRVTARWINFDQARFHSSRAPMHPLLHVLMATVAILSLIMLGPSLTV